MRKLFFMIVFLVTLTVEATLPKDCIIEEVTTELVNITTQDKISIYAHNKSDADVFLVNSEIPLVIKLAPDVWNMILLKKAKSSEFSCIESKPGAEQKINCSDVLGLCRVHS